MSAVVQQNQAAQVNPIVKLKEQFDSREDSFKAALPAHIPVERFMRVVMTATQRNPELVQADRASLFNSSLLAAQDGLLPDGREGALVIYNMKKDGGWIKAVQWMPMIAGILKKCRNSGELSSIEAHAVRANDKFSYRIGIDEQPLHEPDWFGERGDVVGVYAVAKLKDGSRVSEIMSRIEVEKVRAVSRSKDKGPWVEWWEEMARKTVLRRLSKRLPISSDLDDLIRRDDALYDFDGARQDAQQAAPRSLAGKLDAMARSGGAPAIEHQPANDASEQQQEQPAGAGQRAVDPVGAEDAAGAVKNQPRGHTREGTERRMAEDESRSQQHDDDQDEGRFPPADDDTFPGDRPSRSAEDIAYQMGAETKRAGQGTRALPGEFRDPAREAEKQAWIAGHTETPAPVEG